MSSAPTIHREALLRATRATVHGFLSDSARFAAWWGAGSTIEPKVGGRVLIRFVNAVEVGGDVLEFVPRERIVFTYGFRDPAKKPAWGGSRVEFRLADRPEGTLLALHHEFPDVASRDGHVDGWGYQLAVLAGLVAREQHASLIERVDGWFAAWSTDDASERAWLLEKAAADDVHYRSGWGITSGRDELLAHVRAARRHMAGVRRERVGEPRHVQGCVLAEWRGLKPDQSVAMRGTNMFELGPDGRIANGVDFPA
jgi:uncharacterized protein YndB with AHSA1/START domain